jgi:hypothetical protein
MGHSKADPRRDFRETILGMATVASITELLVAWGQGDRLALEQLTPQIHRELHSLAQAYLRRGPPNRTLQATGLINEVFLKLLQQAPPDQLNCPVRIAPPHRMAIGSAADDEAGVDMIQHRRFALVQKRFSIMVWISWPKRWHFQKLCR